MMNDSNIILPRKSILNYFLVPLLKLKTASAYVKVSVQRIEVSRMQLRADARVIVRPPTLLLLILKNTTILSALAKAFIKGHRVKII